MKNMKKLVSLILALVMAMAMAMTTYAANITITNGTNGAKYAAFKLLNATDGGGGKIAYTLNEKYTDVLTQVTGEANQKDILDYIAALDESAVRIFADAVYAKVKDMASDAASEENVIDVTEEGYYLIVETDISGDQDTYSLVMLDTVGDDNVEVSTKEDAPTLTKKVSEKNDTTGATIEWQDAADYDYGDAIAFQLTGTVSERYANYKQYYYAFHDTLEAGLTFDEKTVTVKVGDTDITTSFEITETDGKLDIVCKNLKNVTAVAANSEIVVTYNAVLADTAYIGSSGNSNTAYLEYSNNPYDDSAEPSTSKTVTDKVTVFTYKLVVNKVDKENKALEGAGFTLYKFDFAKDDYVAVGDEITNVTTFDFPGIDAGKYKIEETTVPEGYNKADDIVFTVSATYDTDKADPQLLTLTVDNEKLAADKDTGVVSTDVVNLSGTELPSTGGIGTTIFYVTGSLLMLIAVILLITKKKMTSDK